MEKNKGLKKSELQQHWYYTEQLFLHDLWVSVFDCHQGHICFSSRTHKNMHFCGNSGMSTAIANKSVYIYTVVYCRASLC